MKGWVFRSPVFWKVLFWGLIADWGSKALINYFIEPSRDSPRSISELAGKIYPYPPGHIAITHFEHWSDHWYDLSGLMLGIYNLIERIRRFHISMAYMASARMVGILLLISLESIGQQRPQVSLCVLLGFWIAASIGNTGEVWSYGHATDWIWIRFGRPYLVANIADLLILAAGALLVFRPRRKDVKQTADEPG